MKSAERTLIALLVLAGLAAAGCGGPRREVVQATDMQPESRPVASPQGVWHVIEAGQTLWRIAKVYEVSLDELSRVNDIDDPTSLAIGRRLFVPGATSLREVPAYPLSMSHGERVSPRPPRSRFDWPVADGRILSGYGVPRRSHRHDGIDIGSKHGEPVRAAQSGRVVYSGSTLRGYGKTIIIDHGKELQSLYAHNSDLVAREGDWVQRGQVVARVGRTGNATTDHCHFEIRRKDVPVDPMPYLTSRTESTR